MRDILDYLPGIVLPLAMLYFFFVIPLRRVRGARSWRDTPCVNFSSSVSEDATDSGLYRILLTYRYDFAGRPARQPSATSTPTIPVTPSSSAG